VPKAEKERKDEAMPDPVKALDAMKAQMN